MVDNTVDISESELNDFSLACQAVYNLDENYCEPGRDYELDLQCGKKAYQHDDKADRPFFKRFDQKIIKDYPTYKAFYDLLDNYVASTGTSETVTQVEKKENKTFLDECLKTKPMQYCHKYLVKKGKAQSDVNQFREQLNQIWFELYRRETKNDSSGFEHVFVGEIKKDKVVGFHNWIQLYVSEKKGYLNYKGWVKPRNKNGSKPDGEDRLITIQFDYDDPDTKKEENYEKMAGSSFIGTSPEFELALYTMSFLMGNEDNKVEIAGYDVNVKCYKFTDKYSGKTYIGTAYPELL